jgi:glutamate dehydrogenase
LQKHVPGEGFDAVAAHAKSAPARKPTIAPKPGGFAAYLLARAPAEDTAAYDPPVLARAAALAEKAVLSHRKGESVVAVDTDPAIMRNGRPLTAVTIVNDNMPFLFDSLLGEIADTAGEPTFVTHPVIAVRHGKKGVSEIVADGGKADGVDRLSVIHIHINALSVDEALGLKKRLGRVLTQVRAAVGDWKPMLARLDRAISEFRYQPIPLAKDAVTEAIAFLEWLRDDNFTFLGMREFRYSGGEKSGTLTRSQSAGLGILADPDVRVLRRAEGEATTPEIRSFLYGPDPLIVTKANAKSIVHRRAYLDYVGIKTFDKKGLPASSASSVFSPPPPTRAR